ncbi:Shwachman-Bodian-diamond syndrome protein [Phellopilus nigrolimitatus]|nr:Shwachman-Bodian-diamond syndrome protein [Phellopilus nigrolimitatus]
MPINQPSNQIKLTNVSIVRLKKGGKRFEVACYKNKVQEWRKGVETNLDDVLQISAVFVNVSKGEQAKAGDLKKAFGKAKEAEIIEEILKHGDLQVGEKEREHELGNLRKDIANRVTEGVVDPATQRPYSLGIVEKAMAEVGFSVDPAKNAKSQVLACIKLLQQHSKLPIQRARMRVRVTLPTADVARLEANVREGAEVVEDSETRGEIWEATLQIDPGQFRAYKELLDKEKDGRLDIVDHTVTATAAASSSATG